jgi:hypothetical protein
MDACRMLVTLGGFEIKPSWAVSAGSIRRIVAARFAMQ